MITFRSPSVCITWGCARPTVSDTSRLRKCARAERDDRDLVTRIFGKVFGQESLEEAEPMGLKRLSDEAAKELYPATTEEWAQPLEGEGAEESMLRPMLAQTSIETSPLRLAYDADSNGWTPEAFHEAVNTFGAAIVVAETIGGAIVGGYNPAGWIGLGEDRDSMAAFVFSWPDGDTMKKPIKLPKAFSKLGSYYSRRPDGVRNVFAEGEEIKRGKGTELKWLRAYVTAGGPEQFELDGIIWKTSKAGES